MLALIFETSARSSKSYVRHKNNNDNKLFGTLLANNGRCYFASKYMKIYHLLKFLLQTNRGQSNC